MVGENGIPETPDWSPAAKAWDDRRCCPAGICETPTHAAFMHRLADLNLDGLGDN